MSVTYDTANIASTTYDMETTAFAEYVVHQLMTIQRLHEEAFLLEVIRE